MPEHKPAASGWWVLPDNPDGIPVHLRKEGFFVPKPLPSSLVVDSTTQQWRSRADYTLGRLREATAVLPDRKVLVRPTQHHEIQSMLAFRGVTVTNREIASVDLPEQVVALRPPYEVVRYLDVMAAATRHVHTTPVGQVLKRVARELAGLPDGAAVDGLPWRTKPRWFGGSRDNAYLTAVEPGAELRVGTEQLFEWIDDATGNPPVDKAAMGAYQLFTLDPFTNTADLLHVYVTLELIKSGMLEDQIVPVSVHVDRNRLRFRQAHRQVVNEGNIDAWVRFVADGLTEQSENQLRVVHSLAGLPNKYMANIARSKRKDGFARLMRLLPSFQIVTVDLVAEKCEVSPKHARELLAKAQRLEYVEQIGDRKRNRIYEVKDVRLAIDLYAGIVPTTDRAVTDNN